MKDDIVKIGKVSSIDKSNNTARILLDGSGMVSGNLKVLNNQLWFPNIGQFVACIFLPEGDGDGFVIGGI